MEIIQFCNFWTAYDATKSLLREIFSPLARNGRSVTVTSVYPRKTLVTGLTTRFIQNFGSLDSRNERRLLNSYQLVPPDEKADINILYSGENARPPVDGYDL